MSFFDKAKAKLTDAVGKHGDKIDQGIDKAASLADKKTGGKHGSKITTASQKAKEALDKLDPNGPGNGPAGGPGAPRNNGPLR